MRILFVLHDYLPAHPGGTEIYAHRTARALLASGHEVTCLFTERALERDEGSRRRGELDGVRTIEVAHRREYADARETWEQPRSRRVFEEVCDELRPDVVHFHHFSTWGTGCAPAARERGAAVVATLHDYHLLCDNGFLLRPDGTTCDALPERPCGLCLAGHPFRAERWCAPGESFDAQGVFARAWRERCALHARDLEALHAVLCPSRFLAERVLACGLVERERLRVFPLGQEGPRREPRASDPERPLRVGFVGGLYPEKGAHVVVEAVARLPAGLAELHVHGVLDWFPAYVEDLRRRAGDAAVLFHGPYSPDRVDEVIGSLDLLAVPSQWVENRPLSIQEAQRLAVPVLASDLGALPESLADGVSGRLLPPGDVGAWATAIEGLARDRDELQRLAAGRPALPTLEEVARSLVELYRTCGEGSGHGGGGSTP